MRYPKIFDKQPKITKELLLDLERRGLIVPSVTLRKIGGQSVDLSNCTAGDVVSYPTLAGKLRDNEVSQEDARALLVVEATRKIAPRETHIARLIIVAFSEEKEKVLEQINQWAKNQT